MMNINMFSEQSYKKPADKSVVQYQVTSLNYLLLFRSNTLQPHRLQHPGFPVLQHLPELAQTHVY